MVGAQESSKEHVLIAFEMVHIAYLWITITFGKHKLVDS